MRESGDLLVPRFCGMPRFQKPPLAYWLALLGYEAAGGPGEGSGRFYSAAAGVLAVLLLYAFGRRLGAPRIGLWAGVILATSHLFFRSARSAETDVLLTAAITAAILALHRALEGPPGPGPEAGARVRRGWIAAAWAAMAVGFLAKGPPAVGLPLLVAALHLALARRFRDIPRLFSPAAVVLFLAIAAPWYVAVLARGAWDTFLFELRTTAGGEDHGKGVLWALFYYPVHVWQDFAPWCVLLPALALGWRRLRSAPGARLFLTWTIAMAGALLLVGNKQPHYFIPVLPALSWLSAAWILTAAPAALPRLGRRAVPAAAAVAGVALAALLSWVLVIEPATRGGKEREAAREFGKEARPLVQGAPLYLLGEHIPALEYYLEKVAEPLGGDREKLRALPAKEPVRLVVLDSELAPEGASPPPGPPRGASPRPPLPPGALRLRLPPLPGGRRRRGDPPPAGDVAAHGVLLRVAEVRQLAAEGGQLGERLLVVHPQVLHL